MNFLSKFPLARRIFTAVGILIGGSWVAVKVLEQHLTPLLIDATSEALNDLEVQEDTYEFLKKLLTRLFEDPESRETSLDFLKHVLKVEVLEKAVLELTVETMEKPEYRVNGLSFMRELTKFILEHREMKGSVHEMAEGLLGSLTAANEIRNIEAISHEFKKVSRSTAYKLPCVAFHDAVIDQIEFYNTIILQRGIVQLLGVNAPKLVFPTTNYKITQFPPLTHKIQGTMDEFYVEYRINSLIYQHSKPKENTILDIPIDLIEIKHFQY